jgi:uncharacterized cupredoxin-like copper-binding protein
MSASAQQKEERIPVGQVLYDDIFLLFLLGVVVPFIFFTVWGLIDVGSVPLAKPVAIAAQPVAPLPAGAVVVNATMTEFKVTLSQTSVPAGKPVRFALDNKGAIAHDFVIEKVGAVNAPLTSGSNQARAQEVVPGGSAVLDWTFSDAGEYQIACHVPGHYEAGMVVKITVTK